MKHTPDGVCVCIHIEEGAENLQNTLKRFDFQALFFEGEENFPELSTCLLPKIMTNERLNILNK